MRYLLIFSCFISLLHTPCFAQKSNVFAIDENRILLDKNLGFFLSRLRSEHFRQLTGKSEISQFIKKQLPYFNDAAIADPGKEYQATDVIVKDLPARQLIFLAKSRDVYIINYLTGGFGTTTHFTFIKYQGQKVLDVWSGYGCDNCHSVEQITACIKRKMLHKHGGLHTNQVDL